MKLSELKLQSLDQLREELSKLKKEQFNLRFQQAAGQVEKTSDIKKVRRQIARVRTIVCQKAK
ncbi:50S ribosomal protein L29 [Bartonella sp. TP]|uniref:50S ribosomal protein L29 n=1 Tax=Bartonella sp. TP TaxID=3057550 RepID=UPI0025AF44F3|nr:50S ribosomal protein L29 [Bartonella sp. TP]MDN5248681.1 50S ribosomal protein L29 [Alphaproteobacteria bacterium]WJW79815.1 50S ribosomal protein L29 [Bartonella sp. TP]